MIGTFLAVILGTFIGRTLSCFVVDIWRERRAQRKAWDAIDKRL